MIIQGDNKMATPHKRKKEDLDTRTAKELARSDTALETIQRGTTDSDFTSEERALYKLLKTTPDEIRKENKAFDKYWETDEKGLYVNRIGHASKNKAEQKLANQFVRAYADKIIEKLHRYHVEKHPEYKEVPLEEFKEHLMPTLYGIEEREILQHLLNTVTVDEDHLDEAIHKILAAKKPEVALSHEVKNLIRPGLTPDQRTENIDKINTKIAEWIDKIGYKGAVPSIYDEASAQQAAGMVSQIAMQKAKQDLAQSGYLAKEPAAKDKKKKKEYRM